MGSEDHRALASAHSRLTPFLLVALCLLEGCSTSHVPWNLILVSVDTLRADHLSCYGSSEAETPGFERLAREGLLFENATSVAPTTLPAHASLLTGLNPSTHWVHDNVGFRLRPDLPTLASILKAHGYRTGGFVGSFVLNRKFGLDPGFDVYSDEMPVTDRGLRERRGAEVLDEALAWMSANPERPFFAFLHFFDPHRPYDPPAPFTGATTDLDIDALHLLYRGEVSYVDSLLQRLLAFLDERGLSESTVVVVTADHGESLGEHGEDTHGFFLYQSTLHVPLLIRAPSIPPERRGQRVAAVARTIDVAPTALQLLGMEAPGSMEGVSFVTKSGEVRPPDVDALSETFVPRLYYGWSELRSLRRGKWKLVLAPRSELYDLESDPNEAHNLFEERGDVAQRLVAALEERPRAQDILPERLDRGTLASLQALGYLGASAATPSKELSFDELPDPKDKLSAYNELNELTAVSHPTVADIEQLARLLEQEPHSTRALSMLGNLLLDLRRAQDARDAFARLLDIAEDSYDARYGMGRALTILGETDAARASFEKARALDPRSADVYRSLSSLEKSVGNLEASERWLSEGLDVAPNRLLYQDLADLLIAAGRAAEVNRVVNEWSGPGAQAAATYARGQVLASRGDDEGALVELERAHRGAPEDDNLEQELANTLSRLGKFEDAKRHYESIVSRSPCYLAALLNLGVIHESQKALEAAIRDYETAIECDASYANAYRNLGATLARKGDTRRALDVLRQAKRLLPADDELAAAIVELDSLR